MRPRKIRIPPPMALWRLCDLGQPQRHPQGQPGLRHGRAALPLPPDAEGRDAGLIERRRVDAASPAHPALLAYKTPTIRESSRSGLGRVRPERATATG